MNEPASRQDRPRVVVVGGGISGLAAAYELRSSRPDLAVTLLEAADRLGGKVRTEHVAGFTIEGGPDSLVTFKPAALALARELGLTAELRPADESTAGSHVLGDGRLRPVPAGMNGFMPQRVWPIATTRLLPLRTKLRMAMEYAVPRSHDPRDETVEAFVTRRLGHGVYRRLIEPMVGAIFAADPARLSIEGTLPHLREAERDHGSLVRAVLAQRRATARAGRPGPRGASPATLVAPAGGMGRLVEELVRRLDGVPIGLGTRVAAVESVEEGYLLRVVDAAGAASVLTADGVVLAVQAPVAAGLLERLEPGVAATLRRTPYSSTVTVSLGYRAEDVPTLPKGHGYLVPQREGRTARACTWSSVKFPGLRAPAGHVLLRVSLGGPDRDLSGRSDDELVDLAREEVAQTLGVRAEPVVARAFAWTGVMPQYAPGHRERVADAELALGRRPGLALAGSAYHGQSVSDCVASGRRAATAVAAALT